MGFLSSLFGSPAQDEPFDVQRLHAERWLRGVKEDMARAGIASNLELRPCDDRVVWANKTAPFGRSWENPVPTNGLMGTICYLQRLRSKSGNLYLFHRIGSVEAPQAGSGRVDQYELLSSDGSERHAVFVDMHCTRRSQLAPSEMSLSPLPKRDSPEYTFVAMPMTGTNDNVPNFPHGLPDAVRRFHEDLGLPAAMTSGMARVLAPLIAKLPRLAPTGLPKDPPPPKPSQAAERPARLVLAAGVFGAQLAPSGDGELAMLTDCGSFAADLVTACAAAGGVDMTQKSIQRLAMMISVFPVTGSTCQWMKAEPFEMAVIFAHTRLMPVSGVNEQNAEDIGTKMADEQHSLVQLYTAFSRNPRYAPAIDAIGQATFEFLFKNPTSSGFGAVRAAVLAWVAVLSAAGTPRTSS